MEFIDQIGHKFLMDERPNRIISLVPSQTELLHELGLSEAVVGITKFCVHPKEWFERKTRVGGTKTVDINRIEQLKPDLIIANKEENDESQIKALQERFAVYTSDIKTLSESLKMIADIGELTDTKSKASVIGQHIRTKFDQLKSFHGEHNKVLYLIWKEPIMSAGNDTFVNDMLETCGFQNAIQEPRYPELSPEKIKALNPAFIFLSSEPFPFKEKHINYFQDIYPKAKIVLVDGEYFSWYGARLINAPGYFSELINKIS